MGSVSIKSRIRFGYVLFVIALASVPLIENGAESGHISRPTGFWLTLFTVGLIAVGGGIQQSSFYGFAAFLPPKYTQGLMFGESLAGVIVSFNRIWTKASNADTDAGLRDSTFLFFYMSIVFIVSCFVLHEVASRSEFSLHYTKRLSTPIASSETANIRKKRMVSNGGGSGSNASSDDGESLLPGSPSSPTRDGGSGIVGAGGSSAATGESGAAGNGSGGGGGVGSYGVGGNSNSNGSGSGSGSGDENDAAQSRGAALRAAETPKQRRKRVAELVVSPMLAVAGSFIVTLSVFPGVTSAVPSKAMRDWMPIVMMAVFNVGDLIGKALPFLPFSMFQASSWTTAGLIKFVAARVPLIVILVLCAAPYPLPALRGEAWGLIATFVLAVSGGYTATIAMTIGPMQVPAAGQ